VAADGLDSEPCGEGQREAGHRRSRSGRTGRVTGLAGETYMSSNARWAAGDAEPSPPAQETRRSVLARAGLLASGAGIAALITTEQAAAAQIDDTLDVVPPA